MGTAIGSVYAWGMVGSLLGTFLTGFYLIDWLGTKGMMLAIATALAMAATILGSVWHAALGGDPAGPLRDRLRAEPAWLEKQAVAWGIREKKATPPTTDDELAWVDESQYYYIKVINERTTASARNAPSCWTT